MRNLKNVIMIILILIIFFVLCSYSGRKKMIGYEVEVGENGIKEDFITWYLPFYSKISVDVPKYLADPITYSDLKYRYNKYLNFYLHKRFKSDELNSYYRFIFSNILANTFIQKFYINYTRDHIDNLRLINKDKHNLTIVSAPIIENTIGNERELYQNINFVVSLSYMYLFFISTKDKGIINIEGIKGRRINIGEPYTEEYFLSRSIINNLGLGDNDITITTYGNEEAFSKLFSGEIDGLVLNDFYPSPVLEKYMLLDFTKMLQVIPWDGLNNELFETAHPYMKRVSIDLNLMPGNYLPQKIGNKEYTRYKPIFETYQYTLDMLCNTNLEPRVSYQVAMSIFNNIDIINEQTLRNPFNKIFFPDIAVNFYNIPVHIGAKLFYNEKTAYTQNSSIYCANYIGKEKCDDRKVMEAKILESSGMAMGVV